MYLEGPTTSILQCNSSDKWCRGRTSASQHHLGHITLFVLSPNFPVCGMGNRDIFPYIGKVLTRDKVQVGCLYLRLPLSFCYTYLPKVLDNIVDFFRLLWNFFYGGGIMWLGGIW